MNLKSIKRTITAGIAVALLGGGFYASGLSGRGQQVQFHKSALTRIQFSAPGGSDVTNSVIATNAVSESDAVLAFIETRSGVKLEESAKTALRDSQSRNLADRSGMDTNDFADELAKTLVDRIRTATNEEYNDYIAGLLRSKKSIIVPQDATGPRVKGTLVSGNELARLAKSVRNGKYDPNFASYFAGGQLRLVVAAHISLIAKTSPSFMASTRDGKYLPPAQRLLLTYLILSGDAGFKEQEGTGPLVGSNGKFVDIPFAFFLNVNTIKRLAS